MGSARPGLHGDPAARRRRRTALAVACAAVLSLAGCAGQRPEPLMCAGLTVPVTPGDVSPQGLRAASLEDPVVTALRDGLEKRSAEPGVRPLRRGPLEIEVLALSTGGQWGAFGAGFLTGWSATPAGRPDFFLVTGGSAGGTLAPIAFAGPAYDPLLGLYDGLSEADVGRNRGPLALLFSPGFFDRQKLKRTLADALATEGLIDDIVAGQDSGRRLLLGAVNADSGRFEMLDMGAFAARESDTATRLACLTEAVMATSAIPLVFGPSYINGALYVDSGVRQNLFFTQLETAVTAFERDTGTPVEVTAYMVINSDFRVSEAVTGNNAAGIGLRSVELLNNQNFRESIRRGVQFARQQGWDVRAVTAAQVLGEGEGGGSSLSGDVIFSEVFTKRLFERGQALAQRRDPWLTDTELLEVLNE